MTIPSRFEFECPVKVHFGERALEHLPFELRALDAAKPLVICDGQASREGCLASVIKAFRNAAMTLGVVEDVAGEDPQTIVPQLAAIYRDKDCDAIVAVGQGGFIDAAKWLNLAVSTGEEELEAFAEGRALPPLTQPLAVIPPAAADGFETSGYLRGNAATLRSVHLMPRLLFLDKRTVGAPDDAIMAETALVALTHGLESFFQGGGNPMTAVYARTAVRLAASVLHQLAHRGKRDSHLALTVAHAAALSGCALGAAPPALTHRLGTAVAQNGKATAAQAMGVILSYALEHRAVEGRLDAALLLELLGGRDRYARTPAGQRGPAAFYFLRNLLNLLFEGTGGRVKRTLLDLGMTAEEVRQAAERAGADGDRDALAQASAILTHAWEGQPFLATDGHR